ncbi:hypothetical protein KKG31_00280 [Patescibacteria group bacterium]|nr:hypothetical protein [Patescibacteria group bacterium]MBU1757627.1 hypothetical protein [Patescibacteria group bacterium]
MDEKTGNSFRYEQTMDRSMFALFVASKRLQPKSSKALQEENRVKSTEDE